VSELNIGLMLPTVTPRREPIDPGRVVDDARWAERNGLHSLWAGDHTFHPMQYHDGLVSLAFAAAVTERILVGTSVLVLPLHPLGVVAKQVATLATLSRGRAIVAVGAGGEIAEEFIASGVPVAERGRRMEEAVPLLRSLLVGERVDVEGDFYRLPNVELSPVPPRVPLWLSGRRRAALERAGRLGDGWLGAFHTPESFARARAVVEEVREQAGRSDERFGYGLLLPFRFDDRDDGAQLRAAGVLNGQHDSDRILTDDERLKGFLAAGTPSQVLEQIGDYVDAGCRTFVLSAVETDPQIRREQLEQLAADLLPALS
jgi:alkanesulfonate monooxygenase SsuD/methylene tetrahydromethanopterin reductase-like flavin-dependent oxidoreductase (luciferase family)